MKAIGLKTSNRLEEFNLPVPELQSYDLLVEIKASALNPVDTKIRRRTKESSDPRILGWDAAGIVKAVGSQVSRFKIGDEVYYAGELNRAGSNAELQVIDERLVAHKPKSLTFLEAAALPLTTITAYEGLFNRLGFNKEKNYSDETLLVIGGAGGVGGMVIQLARLIPDLKIIASASRPESKKSCLQLGADEVIDHPNELSPENRLSSYDAIFCTQSTDDYFDPMSKIIAPEGKIVAIVETTKPLNLDLLKSKSVSFAWESMFTRSIYKRGMEKQGQLLEEVAHYIDIGRVKSPPITVLKGLNLENLKRGHALIEEGKMIGKLVIEY